MPATSAPVRDDQKFELRYGAYTAIVTSHGAALHSLRHEQRDLVVPFEPRPALPDYRGVICAPWPNRLADGRYEWDGRHIQTPINEPDRITALHGLVFDRLWSASHVDGHSVTLETSLAHEDGYPFHLHLQVSYALGSDGLQGTITATNTGTEALPYGACPHPYLVAGNSPMNEWTLTLPAGSFLETSPDRLLPLREVAVEGGTFDFRAGKSLRGIQVDHAFTRLSRGPDGFAAVSVVDPSGTGVELVSGPEWPWLQICTGDKAQGPDRLGVAVEPMTCPPDAFNSGTDVVRLVPGERHIASWLIKSHTVAPPQNRRPSQ